MMLYAARWIHAWYDDADVRQEKERLVVVEADTPEDAQQATGLVVEEFHEATDDEIEEWDDLTEKPMEDSEVGMMVSLVRSELREIARRRRRDRVTGRWNAETDVAFDSNRGRAYRLLRLLGKLEVRDEVEQS
jgi:hypothetical protein